MRLVERSASWQMAQPGSASASRTSNAVESRGAAWLTPTTLACGRADRLDNARHFGDDRPRDQLDTYRSHAVFDSSTSSDHLDVAVDWASAYELLVSFVTFAERDKHTLDELGPDWLPHVRHALPADFAVK